MGKNNPTKIDNIFEMVVTLFNDKNWWKTIIFLLILGMVVTGFTCDPVTKVFKKDPIYQRSDKK